MSFWQEELARYPLKVTDAQLIREKDGIAVARVRCGPEAYVLKVFEAEAYRREIRNYEILRGCGVPTLRIYGQTPRSLLLEDISASPRYRLGEESDLRDGRVITALARWYRTLHDKGRTYVQTAGQDMYDEWDFFSREWLERVEKALHPEGSPGFGALWAHFDAIKSRVDALPRTLTYNDFYYTNLAVGKKLDEALMFDYNLLGKGAAVSDIRNVTYWLSPGNARLFLEAYGGADREQMLLDQAVSPFITLAMAVERDIFPDWAREALSLLEQKTPALIAQLLDIPLSPAERTCYNEQNAQEDTP